ncbi:sensor histidine kinase [Paradesulfitobacterium ferrireducens]|uniref:sensor histidine kinase n=1 Tax=Paradesulfitobacterium ferrireducens TaxID=2816476 RepID=UPI001A8CFA1D|nr:ATP-binding protein [Paradesulfitobacterium ferrireducens]
MRIKLIIAFALCLLAAIISGALIEPFTRYHYPAKPYVLTQESTEEHALSIQRTVFNLANSTRINLDAPAKDLQEILDQYRSFPQEKIYILDKSGKVLYHSSNADKTEFDIFQLLKLEAESRWGARFGPNEMVARDSRTWQGYNTYHALVPYTLENAEGFVYVTGEALDVPVYEAQSRSFLGPWLKLVFPVAVFLGLFYYLTRPSLRYFSEVAQGLQVIARGDLSYQLPKKSEDELGILADNINSMTRQLRDTLEAERLAERTKKELITNVSHDLRTPLTSIIGYLGLLVQNKHASPEEEQHYLGIAYRKSLRLKNLIEALFEYTKLDAGQMALHKEEVDLAQLLRQLAEEFVPLCEQEGVKMQFLAPAEKLLLHGDGNKLARVFENLISNALKYGKEGKLIRVNVRDEGNWNVVSVINYGPEIPAEEIAHIFERFYRVEKSRAEETGGSGLGLAISKQIVELHGGMISATSTQGETVFTVRLKKSIC